MSTASCVNKSCVLERQSDGSYRVAVFESGRTVVAQTGLSYEEAVAIMDENMYREAK